MPSPLTALPDLLHLTWAALVLSVLFFVPGFLALKIFQAREKQAESLNAFETITASVALSVLITALTAIALVFSFGLYNYSLALTMLAVIGLEYLYLKK